MLFAYALVLVIIISLSGKWINNHLSAISWEAPAAILAILHLLLSIVCFIKLRKPPTQPFYSTTIQELKNDCPWFHANKSNKKKKP